jgi:hypothetical protein
MHSHSNKSTLDDIGASDVTAWNAAASASHSHSNKSVLDGITSTKVGNWDDATALVSVLGGVTAEDVADWDDAATKAHSHSNKSTLDGITSTKVTNWDAAYTDKHSHTNKSVLDGIDATKVAAWDAAAQGDTIDVSIGGTAAAPTVAVALGSGSDDSVALPVADASHAGIVSTGAQTFAGNKTFDRIYLGNSGSYSMYIEWDNTAHAFKIVGDVYATGDVAAGA